VYVQIDKYKEKKRKLQAKATEITSLSATDLWLRDLDTLEAEWNRILRSSASNVDNENTGAVGEDCMRKYLLLENGSKFWLSLYMGW